MKQRGPSDVFLKVRAAQACAWLLLWIFPPFILVLSAQDVAEYAVKAAFLLNFARFVEWPPSAFQNALSPLEICILGRNPFDHLLEDIVRGETVQDRTIAIRYVMEVPNQGSCQILFINSDVKAIRGRVPAGVLVVADDPRSLNAVAMMTFVVDARRVRFDVNQKAAESAGLKISSKLLAVARRVVQ